MQRQNQLSESRQKRGTGFFTRAFTGPFTGWHMAGLMVAFFAIIIAANVYMVTAAIRTYPGEDIKQSYRQGLAYNDTIAARANQKATGWQADIAVVARTVQLRIADINDVAVRGLYIQARLKHPAQTNLDRVLAFKFNEQEQAYFAPLSQDISGRYIFVSQAYFKNPDRTDEKQTDGDIDVVTQKIRPVFKTKNVIMIQAPMIKAP